ncbi:DUF3160 domain-containing protein [Treponema sp.]|uniref:DUF3160 domain-containing protein n=1 Tax=Treponema sp. TaxID=166 RepID=UPI00298D9AA8|nr:DUF3160 domain-containing protein [Treponema sp.]MCR5612153.1 DUF3160 domain-containing protein [Treponema sp.]
MKKFFGFLLIVLILTGCKKKPDAKKSGSGDTQNTVEQNASSYQNEDSSNEKLSIEVKPYVPNESVDNKVMTSAKVDSSSKNAPKAHAKFLDEDLVFSEMPGGDLNSSSLFLVASNKCELYSEDCFVLDDEYRGTYHLVSDNIKGEPIPLGTLLVDQGVIIRGSSDPDKGFYDGLFLFQDNYNFFYKVKYGDKIGYVFGADLHHVGTGIVNDNNRNRYYSVLLLSNGKPDKFYPYEGQNFIVSDAVRDSLKEYKLAMTDYGGYSSVDELTGGYNQITDYTPVFVTTDLASHVQHLMFDKILQQTEENFFSPKLKEITDLFIEKINSRTDVSDEVKTLAVKYFQVPQLILRLSPQKDEDGEYEEVKNSEQILSEYPEDVVSDYQSILNASGENSAIFKIREPFSMYKPRGHYTNTSALENYFRAQMWFGRIHFVIAQSEVNPLTDEQLLKMEPVALLVIDTVRKNPELYEKWAKLFDPITSLIGDCDDLSIRELLPVWKEQNAEDFKAWVSDKNNLVKFAKICHEKLEPPAISGNSVFFSASEDQKNADGSVTRKPPMGWRFLGQRFTYDSYIHQLTNLHGQRPMVRGLDVMKVFGSKIADRLLSEYDYLEPSPDEQNLYKGGAAFKKVINDCQKEFEKLPESFWSKNYYNSVLNQIRTQATFEQGAGYYFTQSPLWGVKSLISSHSTWAELRHDTILYVKQTFAEMAGGGELDPTFRTVVIPRPVNYIEPNLKFWEAGKRSIDILCNILIDNGFYNDDVKYVLDELSKIYSHAIEIVKLEMQDESISEVDNKWIKTVPHILEQMIIFGKPEAWLEESDRQMACIADVYTNADIGVCLEVGVARPIKLYVPLNDKSGGKRIAIGFMPSYAEFVGNAGNRLNDKEWKQIVYAYSDSRSDLRDYKPEWETKCVVGN